MVKKTSCHRFIDARRQQALFRIQTSVSVDFEDRESVFLDRGVLPVPGRMAKRKSPRQDKEGTNLFTVDL
jgi:hypothetical protein